MNYELIIIKNHKFFGFVVVRIGAAPNDDSVKLAKIPKDQQLTKDGYKDAYPLEYESFMKNNEMHPSPTGYGGSDKVDHLKEQPEAVQNFKGYKFAIQYDDDRGHTYAGICNCSGKCSGKGKFII